VRDFFFFDVLKLISFLLLSLLFLVRERYVEEGRDISNYIRNIHHSRKISHQQVNYPDTVQKLSTILSNKSNPFSTSPSQTSAFGSLQQGDQFFNTTSSSAFLSTNNHSSSPSMNSTHNSSKYFITQNLEQKSYKLKEHQEKIKEYMSSEHMMNERKRLYNREVGRKAVVNEVTIFLSIPTFSRLTLSFMFSQVISGTGPVPSKTFLFPHKASHEQILALTGTLKAPNPHILPPEIPRTKKWRGDGEGWST
jgi:hypothetical protein